MQRYLYLLLGRKELVPCSAAPLTALQPCKGAYLPIYISRDQTWVLEGRSQGVLINLQRLCVKALKTHLVVVSGSDEHTTFCQEGF